MIADVIHDADYLTSTQRLTLAHEFASIIAEGSARVEYDLFMLAAGFRKKSEKKRKARKN